MAVLSPDRETGGILMGPEALPNAVCVTQVSGPGLRAIRRRTFFLRDTEYCQGVLADNHARYGIDYVGEWHSHVTPLHQLSHGDVDTLRRIINDTSYSFTQFVCILAIVSQDRRGESVAVEVRGYVVAPIGIQEMSLKVVV